MQDQYLDTLEYPKILQQLVEHTAFSASRELALALRPVADVETVRHRQQETTEAKDLLSTRVELSVGGARDVRAQARRAQLDAVLPAEDLLAIDNTLRAGRELYRKLAPLDEEAPLLADKGGQIRPLHHVIEEIERCLDADGQVLDSASPELARIRRESFTARERLLERLRRLVSSSDTARFLQEPIVTERNGRYVIPLKVEFRGRIPGIVQDQSSSGATLFIEPLATIELNNHWLELKIAERHEVARILRMLSALVGDEADNINNNVRLLAEIDLALAKAHYSYALNGVEPALTDARWPLSESPLPPHEHPVHLLKARHPLLNPATVVPIDVYLGGEYTVVVITGPNTGGKTVSLKTVGLLAAMHQAGLHIPALDGSRLPVFSGIYSDIGDEQSIEQSLSTFSSHLTHIVDLLDKADERSLVLLDEIGAGTDPVEGAALAQALITEFLERKSLTLCSSHYAELKVYAFSTPGVQNASVEFDVQTLSPTFQLTIGLPGRSNALAIAERLGLSESILEQAREMLSPEALGADVLLENVRNASQAAEVAQRESEETLARTEALERELRQKLGQIEEARRQVIEEAREQGRAELEQMRQELRSWRERVTAQGTKDRGSGESLQEMMRVLERMEEQVQPIEPVREPRTAPDTEMQVGDRVYVPSLEQEGQLQEIDGDEALVSIGGFRVRTELDRLEYRGRGRPKDESPPETPIRRAKGPAPSMELHLRGMRADEAISAVSKYVEEAYLASLPWVHIVHGKGMGVLKQVVRDQLRGHPLVRSWRPGELSEGGDGITVVQLESVE